jgi:hypothetical protein
MRLNLKICSLSVLLIFVFAGMASGTVMTSYTIDGNVDAEVAAFPLSGPGSGSGTLILGSIPAGATIERATLYAHNWFDSTRTPSATFAGTPLGSVSVFDINGGLSAYKWDVTSLITGSGSYNASYAGMTNSYGLALAVVFSHPSLPFNRVIVNDGATEVNPSGTGDTDTTTFNAFAGSGDLWIYTQADDAFSTNETIKFNGNLIGGPIDANLGSYASLFHFNITALDGLNTVEIFSPGDYFGWHLAVLSTPSEGGGGEVPEPATMILLGSGLVGLAGYARKRMKK